MVPSNVTRSAKKAGFLCWLYQSISITCGLNGKHWYNLVSQRNRVNEVPRKICPIVTAGSFNLIRYSTDCTLPPTNRLDSISETTSTISSTFSIFSPMFSRKSAGVGKVLTSGSSLEPHSQNNKGGKFGTIFLGTEPNRKYIILRSRSLLQSWIKKLSNANRFNANNEMTTELW